MNKQNFGQYEVVSELGRGGMGVVYKAHDDALSRDVAIKVLAERLASDDSVVERFKREARSMAALNDSHIIQIYFIGEDQGQPYFVMEFVDGESLSERLKREGKLSVNDALRILKETAEGLSLAHSHGVVHRDIKPGNLMLTTAGKVKIADFGIAMVQDYSKRLTNTGEFVGTPGYLSPEVCVGQPVDNRSDIFALGIVLYEMLTGDIPFTEASPLGMMLEVVKADIPDVRTVNSEVDDRTCAILLRMIAKDPASRYQTCDELLADLKGTQPVAAPAATVVASGDSGFNVARTTALSQLESLPELATPASDRTMVSVPGGEPVPSNFPTEKRSRAPMAIAAVLILGLAGVFGFIFKDRIFDVTPSKDRGGEPVAANTARVINGGNGGARLGPEAGNSAGSASGGSGVSNAELEAELQQLAQAEPGDDDNSQAGETELKLASVAAGGATTNPVSAEQVEPINPRLNVNAARLEETVGAALKSAEAAVSLGLNQAADSVAETQKELQVASVTSAARKSIEPPPPLREPRVVVVAIGDPAIAGPVEQLLEAALLKQDHKILDEAFLPGIDRFSGGGTVDLAGLSALITENGGDILVLAEVDYLGETPLQYYGQYSTLYSANLRVRNILLSERRPLGPGWQRKVDFTTLNAAEKAKEAVDPILEEFTAILSQFKG